MSFLSDNFSSEMRDLLISRKVKTKNGIGETIEIEETPQGFQGVLLPKKPGYDKMIDGQVPINISSHVLYVELSVVINRDDIIIDGNRKRYIARNPEIQPDFGGKDDHQIIPIDHIE